MISYVRTTRECRASQLQPGLYQAVRDYFETHQLGDLDTETLMCCETTSQIQNPNKLTSFLDGNPDSTNQLAMLLTAGWFIWARSGDRSGTTVSGAELKAIQVKAFVASRTKDITLEVSGFMADTKEFVRGDLEMSPDLAAQNFRDALGEAVLKANPPVKSKFPRWMGG